VTLQQPRRVVGPEVGGVVGPAWQARNLVVDHSWQSTTRGSPDDDLWDPDLLAGALAVGAEVDAENPGLRLLPVHLVGMSHWRAISVPAGADHGPAHWWPPNLPPEGLIGTTVVPSDMPKTMEVRCPHDDCELDMFENHYTYDVPDDHSVEDLTCPYCGQAELEEIVV
jgi:hypothetical protein